MRRGSSLTWLWVGMFDGQCSADHLVPSLVWIGGDWGFEPFFLLEPHPPFRGKQKDGCD